MGRTPLANALLSPGDLGDPEPTWPLDLVFCPACSLVQITETVPPELLFRDYRYFSSYSDTMLAHAERLVLETLRERRLGPQDLVVEAASNDGYLLQYYRRAGVPVLGIEPAENVAAVAEAERGIPTRRAFFSETLAGELAAEGKRASVFHAHNVLAHVADLPGFLAGVARLLAPDGVAVVEVPYVRDMIERLEFDTIYHEHLCYFSVTALERLAARHGLRLARAVRVPIHGGSLRAFLRPGGAPPFEGGETVEALLGEERDLGLDRYPYYAGFARRVEDLKASLTRFLAERKAEGASIAVYGASAKGSTLLNYCGIGRETLEYVADRSPHKQGRYTPGTHLEIVPPETLVRTMPDYTLLLTWNFADEILEQQREYRRRGGKFVIPLPEVRIV
jgi:SAM-dependent methyltransferase